MTAGTQPRASGALTILAALLESRTGQEISGNREWRIETALQPILRQRNIATLDALVSNILDGRHHDLADEVVDALLNQESSFFRDAAVFTLIADAAGQIAAEGRALRIWCAGCAKGQEPLSLAMLFAEIAEAGGADCPEIIATDVSDTTLARARKARYSQFEIQRGLPVRRMMHWFELVDGDWIARPELVRRVQFRRQNLIGDPPPAGRFDVILCRNVLFYLSAARRREVLDGFAGALRPGGLLVLGAGETVIGQTRSFEPSARFKGLYEAVAPDATDRRGIAA